MYRRGEHGSWVGEIAAEVGASEYNIRRDITELQDAGVDIEVSRRDNRSIACLTSERNYSPVSITKRERITLLAVRGTPLHADVISVLAKLEQRLNTAERSEAASLRDLAYVPDGGTKTTNKTSSTRSDRHLVAQDRALRVQGLARSCEARFPGTVRAAALPARSSTPLASRGTFAANLEPLMS